MLEQRIQQHFFESADLQYQAADLLARPIAEGSTLTIGIAAELSMFVGFWALVALYVRRANGEFDALTAEVVKDAQAELGHSGRGAA
jgi:uncharacterized membrane protein (DUF485 family)